jgi:hypothetical protein
MTSEDTRRQIDHRLRAETLIDDGSKWTIEDLSSRHHNRQTLLQEAQRIVKQGAGYEEALEAFLSFLGTEEDPINEPPVTSHLKDDVIRDENNLRWLMPTQPRSAATYPFWYPKQRRVQLTDLTSTKCGHTQTLVGHLTRQRSASSTRDQCTTRRPPSRSPRRCPHHSATASETSGADGPNLSPRC